MAKYEIDVHLERPCARCGRKAVTFSASNADKGLCSRCIVQDVRQKNRRPRSKPA